MNPFEEKDRTFNAPWEAEAFALVVSLNEKGVFSWSEWAETLGTEIKAAPERPYYESWLAALERLVEAKSLVNHDERQERIAAWGLAARLTPHGKPIELSRAFAAQETSQAARTRKSGEHR